MVGDRGDSRAYVESKKKACADVGFESYSASLSENISEELLLKVNAGCGTSSRDARRGEESCTEYRGTLRFRL